MTPIAMSFVFAVLASLGLAGPSATDDPQPAPQQVSSRAALIEQEQAAKAQSLTPAAPGKAEKYVTDIAEIMLSGQLHWHPFWQSAYSGGGFTIGAGYTRFISPYNFIDVRGSITPSGYKRARSAAHRAGTVRAARHALGDWRLARGDASRILRFRDELAARQSRQLQLPAAVRIGAARGVPRAKRVPRPRRRRAHAVEAAAGLGRCAVGRAGVHARHAARTRRGADLLAHARHDRLRLAARARLRAARRILRRRPFTTTPIRMGSSASIRSTTKRFSTSRSCATPGSSRCAAGRRRHTSKDGAADSVLHDAVDRRRIGPARVHELAAARSQQPRAAGGVARDRSTGSSTWRSSTTPARWPRSRTDLDLDGMKSDVGLGFRLHGPIATPLRIEFTHGHEGFALVLAASEVF